VTNGIVDIPAVTAAHQGRYVGTAVGGAVVGVIDLQVQNDGTVPARGRGVVLLVVALSLLVVVWFAVAITHPRSGTGLTFASYATATVVLAALMALVSGLVKLNRADRGFFSLFVGADRRASTSKTQVMLWTLSIAFALAYIGTRTALAGASFICESDKSANCVLESTWETYLLLLGLPAAAAVLAKGITAAKVSDGELQKSQGNEPSTTQLATDDNGNADLADVQYLIFNFIALLYVWARFIDRGVLPEVPSVLLALTGAAAATYTLNKGFQSNKPVILSVRPGILAPDDFVIVNGQNFFPSGKVPQVMVKVGGKAVQGIPLPGRDGVSITVPPGLSAQESSVAVVTGAGVESAPFPVTIAATPKVKGWVDSPPSPDNEGLLAVSGVAQSSVVDVALDTVVVRGVVDSSNGRVRVHVPPTFTSGDTAQVAVGVNGAWSEPVSLPLA
jgi:hypothetical protein